MEGIMATVVNPEQDPQFAAFQRARDYKANTARADAALGQEVADARFSTNWFPLNMQAEQRSRQVQGDYLSRGMYGSGHHMADIANIRRDIGFQAGQQLLEHQISSAERSQQLARQLAELGMSGEEASLEARRRLTQAMAQSGVGR